jgi:phosphohistidine phosphatase SixA
MPLLLVRHAHAGRRSAHKGDDRIRPLSKRGVAQAVALVPVLTGYRPQRILSSPYLRCSETVRPTAESLSLPIESIDELAEGHEAEAVRLVRRLVGEPAVLCIHGDSAAAVLEWLVAAGGARPGQPRLQKGDVWVIGTRGSSPAILEHIRLPMRAPG